MDDQNQDRPTTPAAEDLSLIMALYLDGLATDEQAETMRAALLSDAASRDLLVSMALAATLASETAGDGNLPPLDLIRASGNADVSPAGIPDPPLPAVGGADDIRPPASPVLGFLGDIGRQGWGFLSDHTTLFSVLALLAVACMVVTVAGWNRNLGTRNTAAKSEIRDLKPEVSDPKSQIPNQKSEIASSSSARLVAAKDCRWNGQSSAPQIGQPLMVGQSLNLASGVAEIDFDVGAKVILQSPAAFQLLSSNSARLKMGKATVEITTEAARGFKILTPETTFVDQGTEFGVEVSPGGNSKIHVFKGMVDVDQKARAGQAPPMTQRLIENAGARMEAGEAGMTLVQDTGECFIRSMDEAGRDQHVVAYWRFEDRPVGILLPNTASNHQSVCASVDSSFNGNDLYVGNSMSQPMFSPEVPAAAVSQSDCPNRSCLDTSEPTMETIGGDLIRRALGGRNVYTHSEFSHASPQDIQRITPPQWTIEASVKAAKLIGKAQGFLGRDADFTGDRVRTDRGPARLTFQINARDRFAIEFYDADGRFHEAVAEDLPVEAGRWYHLAATSDGRTLRLYVDALDGRGYVERAATELPATGSTALGKGQDEAEWTLGRAGNAGNPADWLRFVGWIDEVRISDIAREPAEFLFAPKGKGLGIGD